MCVTYQWRGRRRVAFSIWRYSQSAKFFVISFDFAIECTKLFSLSLKIRKQIRNTEPPSWRERWLHWSHGTFTRYVKLRVAHAAGMPGRFSQPLTSKKTDGQLSRHASRHVHHARAVTHVGIANPRWRVNRSHHSLRMRNPQFYASGKRPIGVVFATACGATNDGKLVSHDSFTLLYYQGLLLLTLINFNPPMDKLSPAQ